MPQFLKKAEILRRSDHFNQIKPYQNLIWPDEPSFNNPIVAVQGLDFYLKFTLLNGDKINIETNKAL
jgi:hypothetical protein